MVESGIKSLSGITATTALREHNNRWLDTACETDMDVVLRVNFERDENLEKRVGMIHLKDTYEGTPQNPAEVVIGGNEAIVTKSKYI